MIYRSGSRVKVVADTCGHMIPIGTVVRVTGTTGSYVHQDYNMSYCMSDDLILFEERGKSNEINMSSLIHKIQLAAKPEPEKSFIEVGVTSMDGTLTSEGKEAFMAYLLEANKEDFNTKVVQPILAEEKE